MGHYLTPIKLQHNNEIKFPCLDASIIPLVWVKNNMGEIDFAITLEKEKMLEIAKFGQPYEKGLASDILKVMKDNDCETMLFLIELSTGSGKTFLNMFKDILPIEAKFEKGIYFVHHDHTTSRIL